jgi:antitoxin (DNA-binding transcriptional repressor) of toxin-antitoxin stability system
MFRTISMAEAQATLPDLIDTLVPGETVVITQDDQPVATLVRQPSAARKPPQFGSAKGMLIINVEDDEHLKDFAEYMPADCS